MTTGGSPLASDQPRNRAERRAATRRNRGRKAVAALTGASLVTTGMGVLFASPASADPPSVTTGADSGAGSLRQAILDANTNPGPDVITFGGVSTVTISSGSIPVTGPLTIDGSDAPGLVLTTDSSTHNGFASMFTAGAVSLTIQDVAISGAIGHDDGAVFYGADTDLTLSRVEVSGNTATGGNGGALWLNRGTLDVTDSTFSDNHALYNDRGGYGGAIWAKGTEVTLTDTDFSENYARYVGGAVYLAKHADNTTGSSATISGGAFTDNHANSRGGAVSSSNIASSALSVTGTTFSGNSAYGGGALYSRLADAAVVSISGATFLDNEANGNGGAVRIRAYGGSHAVTVDDSTFGSLGYGNHAQQEGGGLSVVNQSGASTQVAITGSTTFEAGEAQSGGAVAAHNYDGTLQVSLTGTTVSGNDSTLRGAGVFVYGGNSGTTDLVVTDSRILGNEANTSSPYLTYGGGIMTKTISGSVSASIVGTTISGNSAGVGGGAHLETTTATITGSTVSGNDSTDGSAYSGGGGVYAGNSSLAVSSSTISGNHAANVGGGIFSSGPPLSLDRSTITDNVADASGGGVAVYAADVAFTGSIVGGNTSPGADDLWRFGTPGTVTSAYSLVTDPGTSGITATGGNVVGQAPQLGVLANNGGTTKTHLPLSGSPAIDAGDPAVTSGTDQRGLARVVHARVDIGSVEAPYTAPTPAPSSTTPTTQPPAPTPTASGPNGTRTANVPTSAGAVTLDITPPSGSGAPGTAKVDIVAGASLPAGGLKVLGTAFEITVQGGAVGTAKVCFPYSQTELAVSGLDESALQLFHFLADGSREVITSTLDTVNNRICGDTNSFSPFAIGVLGTKRVAGVDAPSTAAALSAGTFPAGVPVVYLTTAGGFADALGAGPAAGSAGGPTLLVRKGEVPAATQAELARLKPARIVLVGGTAVISEAVQAAVAPLAPKVERVAGADRAETAAMLSAATFKPGVPVVYVVNGSSFADGLVAGAAAAANSGPVLLTGRDSISAATQAELARLNPAKVVVVGGTAAVSDAVLASLKATRLAGVDRYATAAAVAETFAAGSAVLAATGEAPADALAAVAAAARTKSAVVLVRPTSVPARLMAALGILKPKAITVVGGTAAVDVDTEANLAKGLGS